MQPNKLHNANEILTRIKRGRCSPELHFFRVASSGKNHTNMKMNFVSLTTFVVILASSVFAQVPFLGRCPAVTVQRNFVPNNYLGDWFEHKKYFAIFQAGGTCVTAKYTDNGNGVVGVLNRQFNPLTKRYSTIMGTAELNNKESGEAKLSVRFPTVGNFPANYWVLGTDYSSYSVVWSCTDLLFLNFQFAWVLTRDRNPSQGTLQAADEVLKRNGVSIRAFTETSQTNCP
ncbi:hypothetical protein B566_EDAN015859 [Ephemera danica]|nr:hypothetical protein B566_EDAN015859 [Ephemera danica]